MKSDDHQFTVLMVAFHFPPWAVSSGLHRTLGFARHLPEQGWCPIVLTANPRAYPESDARQLALIPPDTIVERAFALDAARHLAIRGAYPGLLALPDRWSSWIPGGILAGIRAVRRYRADIIWSTYPIASAHVIAGAIARVSGLPWVADFRDPMVELDARTGEYAPSNPALRRARLWVERLCVRRAAALVFCTEGARRICLDRYPDMAPDKSLVISNGFEELHFKEAQRALLSPALQKSRKVTLVHSGTIYLSADRDPKPFFDAVAGLLRDGVISADSLQIILRAPGHEEQIRRLVRARGIREIVRVEPSLQHVEALAEMLSADGLLLLQGYPSNPAIPAKLYEYLRARRPIFALLDSSGDTATLLKSLGVGQIESLEDTARIARALTQFLRDIAAGSSKMLSEGQTLQYSRAALTAQLSRKFASLRERAM